MSSSCTQSPVNGQDLGSYKAFFAPYEEQSDREIAGRWGERFWTSYTNEDIPEVLEGCIFPKTYFHASLIGYVIGMLVTLGVMQIYGHAQPALLYLVPGTLGSLWGTALIKGDIKTWWAYSEADEEEEKPPSKADKKDDEKAGNWYEWTKSWLIGEPMGKTPPSKEKDERRNGQPQGMRTSKIRDKARINTMNDRGFSRDRQSELIFFSVNLPRKTSSQPNGDPKDDARTRFKGQGSRGLGRRCARGECGEENACRDEEFGA